MILPPPNPAYPFPWQGISLAEQELWQAWAKGNSVTSYDGTKRVRSPVTAYQLIAPVVALVSGDDEVPVLPQGQPFFERACWNFAPAILDYPATWKLTTARAIVPETTWFLWAVQPWFYTAPPQNLTWLFCGTFTMPALTEQGTESDNLVPLLNDAGILFPDLSSHRFVYGLFAYSQGQLELARYQIVPVQQP